MKKNIHATFGLLLLLGCLAALTLYLLPKKSSEETSPAPPRVVKLYRLQLSGQESRITYPGKVQPSRYAELFFRVSGPVIEHNVKYGQTFEAGDVLMRIDPRDYEREVERITQEINLQKVQCNLADIEYERNLKLKASEVATQATLDVVTHNKQANDAKLAALEVALRAANDRLLDTVLRAPFRGTVADLRIENFEMAQAFQPIVLLEDLRQVKIRIGIPAGNLPDVSIYDAEKFANQVFTVTFPGRGTRTFEATVYEFKPLALDNSESYELILQMPQPDDFLVLPGMSAEVHGLPSFQPDQEKRLVLPFAAVVQRNGKSLVWRYDRATESLTACEITPLGPAGDDRLYFTGDLTQGDLVVAAGGDWLQAGEKVRVLNQEVLQ